MNNKNVLKDFEIVLKISDKVYQKVKVYNNENLLSAFNKAKILNNKFRSYDLIGAKLSNYNLKIDAPFNNDPLESFDDIEEGRANKIQNNDVITLNIKEASNSVQNLNTESFLNINTNSRYRNSENIFLYTDSNNENTNSRIYREENHRHNRINNRNHNNRNNNANSNNNVRNGGISKKSTLQSENDKGSNIEDRNNNINIQEMVRQIADRNAQEYGGYPDFFARQPEEYDEQIIINPEWKDYFKEILKLFLNFYSYNFIVLFTIWNLCELTYVLYRMYDTSMYMIYIRVISCGIIILPFIFYSFIFIIKSKEDKTEQISKPIIWNLKIKFICDLISGIYFLIILNETFKLNGIFILIDLVISLTVILLYYCLLKKKCDFSISHQFNIKEKIGKKLFTAFVYILFAYYTIELIFVSIYKDDSEYDLFICRLVAIILYYLCFLIFDLNLALNFYEDQTIYLLVIFAGSILKYVLDVISILFWGYFYAFNDQGRLLTIMLFVDLAIGFFQWYIVVFNFLLL